MSSAAAVTEGNLLTYVIIIIVIVVLVGLLGWFIWYEIEKFIHHIEPDIPITNCTLYGDGQPVGQPDGPTCSNPETELYAGLCYNKCPSGYNRTAVCTCSNIDIQTDCNKYGDGKPVGDPDGPGCDSTSELYAGLCYKKCPEGYKRTAVCSCQTGQVLTDCSKYGASGAPQATCPSGTSYWGGLCYTDQCTLDGGTRTASCTCNFGPYGGVIWQCGGTCPPGSHRTSACTCQKGGIVTDCGRYGASQPPGRSCPTGTEYYAGLCYKNCPTGYNRTAVCSCSNFDVQTDCTKFGVTGIPKICPQGRDYYGAMCYKGCPSGYDRTAVCTCQKGDSLITDCTKFGVGSPSIPNKCPPGRDFYIGDCYKSCPSGYHRIAACTCEKN